MISGSANVYYLIDNYFFQILGLLVILVAVLLAFVLYKLWRWHAVGKAIALSFCTVAFFNIWTAIWPQSSWYIEEFERETNIQLSENVKVLYKDSVFPDPHGDYYSQAAFQLKDAEFDSVLGEIQFSLTQVECSDDRFYLISGLIDSSPDSCWYMLRKNPTETFELIVFDETKIIEFEFNTI